jgi:hypothetical protein
MKSKGLFRAVHVVLALTWLSCPLYGGCTFVNIEGDNNTVSNTGGHGGGVTLPQGQPTTTDQLQHLRDAHRGQQ